MQKPKKSKINNPNLAIIPHTQKAFTITDQMKRKALESVTSGADIYSYLTARVLRECEKEGLVGIGKPQKKAPGHLQQPWFWCMITNAGKKWLEDV